MKRPLFILAALALQFSAFALSKDEMLRRIDESSAAMTSIECDFTQSVESAMFSEPVLSYGKMAYASPDKLRWEYVNPYSCVFSMDGGKVTVIKEGRTVNSADAGRLFGETARVLLGEVIGKPLAVSGKFEISVEEKGKSWQVTLRPLLKQVKQFITEIQLGYDPAKACVVAVRMKWKNGDDVSMTFNKLKINGEARQ